MTVLSPLEPLFDADAGQEIPLPPELATLYGRVGFPRRDDWPYVIANFVTTLDGVASLGIPGQSGGGPISGFNRHDRMVMGLLRAVADAVVVGAGTLRALPGTIWTPEHAFSDLSDAYRDLRKSLGKAALPLNVVVTASGDIAPNCDVFQSGAPVLIVTTEVGADGLRSRRFPTSVTVVPVCASGHLRPRSILAAINRTRTSNLVLVEGGPRLLADFFADSCVDEQFLTLAPQVAGRDETSRRPGMVAGRIFAPEHPIWARLVSIKRGGDHLFLRYAYQQGNSGSDR